MTVPPPAPEISARELAAAIEDGASIQILDVRAPHRVATGHIDIGPESRFHNIVGSQLVAARSQEQVGLDPDVPVAVVCGHGTDSKVAALFLSRFGYDARSVAGGMAGWMLTTLRRELPAPPSLDRLVQFDRIGKGALGYLLVSDGAALVIDPPRDLRPYLEVAEEAAAKIVAVADTHCHADYLSGGPGLAQHLGIPYYLHSADAVYPYDGTPGQVGYEPLEDGATIQVGRATVRVTHTPGHTEGSVSFLLDDQAAFTGDFIFVASIGRPDLAGKTEEWTVQLWDSLTRAKAEWPQGALIYPAHYATEDEHNQDRSVGKRLGEILHDNEALALSDLESFAGWVRSKAGAFPDAYRKIKAVNVGLVQVDGLEAEELEVGRNECALA
jgi:glyoxylase-like metal-dependent hydrolase (beta-lactamase superfamily II)